MFALKAIASIISLGSAFGVDCSLPTLFLGALGGHLFAGSIDAIWPELKLNPTSTRSSA